MQQAATEDEQQTTDEDQMTAISSDDVEQALDEALADDHDDNDNYPDVVDEPPPPKVSKQYQLAADSMGKDILGAMVQELKALPDVWQKMSQQQQGNVIDRMRRQVEELVPKAVGIIAASSVRRLTAEIDKIDIKADGIKAVLSVSRSNNGADLGELFESAGESVFIVLSATDAMLGGMDQVKPEPDQRALNLGHEYNQKGSDGDIADADAIVVDDDPMNANDAESELQYQGMVAKATEFVRTGGGIGVQPIMKLLECSTDEAMAVLDQLEKKEVITPMDGAGRRSLKA